MMKGGWSNNSLILKERTLADDKVQGGPSWGIQVGEIPFSE